MDCCEGLAPEPTYSEVLFIHRLFKPKEEKCLILIKIFCIKLYFDSDVLSCTEYFLQIYRDK